jgi:hypothetical protein
MTITWAIVQLERKLSDGGVFAVHWQATATSDDSPAFTTRNYGSIGVTADPDDADFIAYDDLTENDCLGWVWAQVSKDDTEARLTADLQALENPTTGDGVPWPTNPQEGE